MIILKDFETIRVKDIKSKDYMVLSYNSTIAEAISLFRNTEKEPNIIVIDN